MGTEERPKLSNPEEADSASRRDFMKVASIGALGLAYSSPFIETLSGNRNITSYSMSKITSDHPPSDHNTHSSTTTGPRTGHSRPDRNETGHPGTGSGEKGDLA